MRISDMKDEVTREVTRIETELAETRTKRDAANAKIKTLLTELGEARRFARAFEKRTRTPKK